MNLFRIGLEINSYEDLLAVIEDIESDPSERSRYADQINKNVGHYLESVWPDYDQRIRVSLEQERLLVHFFDPKCDRASYYDMGERSQGCQTFISFLLTIGAEAKHGVITDTVLLLDEPETHLHPSGVRHMLHELIRAARNGNTVVFATHSVFMIDKEEYDRHVILKKEHEQTTIRPSQKNRIGYFMQEEVLYGALDVNLATDFTSRKQHNFVLEGDGDAVLLETFYHHGINSQERPFDLNKTSFYHGGKCRDIQKFFSQKPIQLGTTWIFVLDDDKPAQKLREFVEGAYRDFIGSYIFVFQYSVDALRGREVELEDLLPVDFIKVATENAASDLKIEVDTTLIASDRTFGEYFADIVNTIERREEYKAAVKMHLNNKIADLMKSVKKKGEFEKIAPEYAAWAKGIVQEILDRRKESRATSTK